MLFVYIGVFGVFFEDRIIEHYLLFGFEHVTFILLRHYLLFYHQIPTPTHSGINGRT